MESEFFEGDQEIGDIKYINKIKELNLIILVEDLTKVYEIGDFIVKAVDGVSIQVGTGQMLVIRGFSGAGKTTLLNLIGGLDSPDQGVIYSNGVRITNMNEESLALFRLMNSGFIFQNYNLISTLTCEENIMFPMNLAGMSLKDQRDRAIKLIEDVGLLERREHLPFQLSAGEQQRVAIARALANDPPIILADEPSANLDKKTCGFILDLFKRLKNDEKTLIIATHDDNIIELADQLITFEEGKIIETINK
jgi:putative ABC transport system ATP-binding protein